MLIFKQKQHYCKGKQYKSERFAWFPTKMMIGPEDIKGETIWLEKYIETCEYHGTRISMYPFVGRVDHFILLSKERFSTVMLKKLEE